MKSDASTSQRTPEAAPPLKTMAWMLTRQGSKPMMILSSRQHCDLASPPPMLHCKRSVDALLLRHLARAFAALQACRCLETPFWRQWNLARSSVPLSTADIDPDVDVVPPFFRGNPGILPKQLSSSPSTSESPILVTEDAAVGANGSVILPMTARQMEVKEWKPFRG